MVLLKKIFGPKRMKVTGEWRRLHDEELSDLYRSQDIIRVIKLKKKTGLGWACCTYGRRGR
jgi:hypothetical protein